MIITKEYLKKQGLIVILAAFVLNNSVVTNTYAVPPTQDGIAGITAFSNFLQKASILSLQKLYDLFIGVDSDKDKGTNNNPLVVGSSGRVNAVNNPLVVGSSGRVNAVNNPLVVGSSGHVNAVNNPLVVGSSGRVNAVTNPLVVGSSGRVNAVTNPLVVGGSNRINATNNPLAVGGSNKVSTEDTESVRYLYSPRWGWVDMVHFVASATITNRYGVFRAFFLATGKEISQIKKESKSAFSYEDRISNALGIYFSAKYAKTDPVKKLSFKTALIDYLKELGFCDTPENAPNYKQIAKNITEVGKMETTRNYTYTPMFATEPRDQDIDLDIKDFINWTL